MADPSLVTVTALPGAARPAITRPPDGSTRTTSKDGVADAPAAPVALPAATEGETVTEGTAACCAGAATPAAVAGDAVDAVVDVAAGGEGAEAEFVAVAPGDCVAALATGGAVAAVVAAGAVLAAPGTGVAVAALLAAGGVAAFGCVAAVSGDGGWFQR